MEHKEHRLLVLRTELIGNEEYGLLLHVKLGPEQAADKDYDSDSSDSSSGNDADSEGKRAGKRSLTDDGPAQACAVPPIKRHEVVPGVHVRGRKGWLKRTLYTIVAQPHVEYAEKVLLACPERELASEAVFKYNLTNVSSEGDVGFFHGCV